MFEFKDNRYTHMPFACPVPDGEPKQFCCIMIDGLWKLHHFTGKRWKRIRTGLPDDATECGPCAEFEDGIWKISFIAGGAKTDRQFRLYRILGIGSDAMPQIEADVGFVRKDKVVFAGRRGPIFIVEPGRTVTLALHGVEYLYRVSYDPQHSNRLLISGQFIGGEFFSWSYQPGVRKLYGVIADGIPAYKTAFYDGASYYAQRKNGGFEDRHIVKAETLELRELPAEEHITETEAATYQRSPNPEFE